MLMTAKQQLIKLVKEQDLPNFAKELKHVKVHEYSLDKFIKKFNLTELCDSDVELDTINALTLVKRYLDKDVAIFSNLHKAGNYPQLQPLLPVINDEYAFQFFNYDMYLTTLVTKYELTIIAVSDKTTTSYAFIKDYALFDLFDKRMTTFINKLNDSVLSNNMGVAQQLATDNQDLMLKLHRLAPFSKCLTAVRPLIFVLPEARELYITILKARFITGAIMV